MFSMLFGVGFYIFLSRLEHRGLGLTAADLYARRLLWLFIIGCLHAYLLWPGDILHHYAVCGFLLLPFRNFRIPHLAVVLLVPLCILLYINWESTLHRQQKFADYSEAISLPEETRSEAQQKTVTEWHERTSKGEPDTLAVAPHHSFIEHLAANEDDTKILKGHIFIPGIFFRTFMLMILGVLLYKTGMFKRYQNVRYYWPITLAVLAAAAICNYYRYDYSTYHYYEPIMNPWINWGMEFNKELMGLSYILIGNGLYQKFIRRIPFNPIIATGRMALTNYLLQSVICAALFYRIGLGQYNQFSRSELVVIMLVVWTFHLIASPLWFRYITYGPVEYLWRKLTYLGKSSPSK